MSALDDIAPSFRDCTRVWPNAQNLRSHYSTLAASFENNGADLLELVKSYIEMVCKTIVKETGHTPNSMKTTTACLSEALRAMGLDGKRGTDTISQVLSGFNKITDGLNQVRNDSGSVAHGKDGFLDSIERNHIRVYILAADSVVQLLITGFEGTEPDILHTRQPYDAHVFRNQRIDSGVAASAFIDDDDGSIVLQLWRGDPDDALTIRTSPSEVLYALDRQAYVNILDLVKDISVSISASQPSKTPATTTLQIRIPAPQVRVVGEYEGPYAAVVDSFAKFLTDHVKSAEKATHSEIRTFVATTLTGMNDLAVVDWDTRQSTQAAVRLFLKRVASTLNLMLDSDEVGEVLRWLTKKVRPNE